MPMLQVVSGDLPVTQMSRVASFPKRPAGDGGVSAWVGDDGQQARYRKQADWCHEIVTLSVRARYANNHSR
jgi:hypothetical protein